MLRAIRKVTLRRWVRPSTATEAAKQHPEKADQYIEQRVDEELACGVEDLASLTARVTASLPEAERFVAAGKIAEIVGRRALP